MKENCTGLVYKGLDLYRTKLFFSLPPSPRQPRMRANLKDWHPCFWTLLLLAVDPSLLLVPSTLSTSALRWGCRRFTWGQNVTSCFHTTMLQIFTLSPSIPGHVKVLLALDNSCPCSCLLHRQMFAIPPSKWNYAIKQKTFLCAFQKPLVFKLSPELKQAFSIPHHIQSGLTAREHRHFQQGAPSTISRFDAMNMEPPK